ncbi:MAG: PDZ domain-containing protein [Cyclobacteriaceae bacterium]
MKNRITLALGLTLGFFTLFAQVDVSMFRQPDVSATHIAFVYAGDIWVVPKAGGTAQKLSSPEGEEKFPKFSPDGSEIAYTANYDGSWDVYVIKTTGGIPKRLTSHSYEDRVQDWHPDGSKILFTSSRESGRQRFRQFFEISKDGGLASKLDLPYGEFGSYSPDGTRLAFNYLTRAHRTWKRYKGGTAPDLFIYDFESGESMNFTNNVSNDELPMWMGSQIFYLSDDGPESRFNIWVYDEATAKNTQVTKFTEWDAHYPSRGDEDIVFEAAGKLYLMDIKTQKYEEVKVNLVTDQIALASKRVDVGSKLSWFDISPDGKRIVAEARGDVFSLPAEDGVTLNLTQTDGAFERTPNWSPDGKQIAYWSDAGGEYQLTLYDVEKGTKETITNYTSGFHYQLFWAPDSKKLAFVDQTMVINYVNLDTKQTVKIDQGKYMMHYGLSNFTCSWSSDSQWLAYAKGGPNRNQSIYLFSVKTGITSQVTSDYYSDSNPTFDPDNKYLFFLTNREIKPVYSDFDNTFAYPNSTLIAAVPLTNEIASPLAPKNDEVKVEEEKKEDEKSKKDKKKNEEEKKEKPVKIDLSGFETRIVLLPAEAGNYAGLQAVSGKLIFGHNPNTGSADKDRPIKYYDLEEREIKTILGNSGGFEVSADGKKIASMTKGKISVVDVKENQKADKTVDVSSMSMDVTPMNEWRQIYWDVWRLQRDFFYDKDMHGVDWKATGDQYAKLLDQCVTRWDVNYVIGELIAELNASHAYRGGGDLERSERLNVGYLGVNWEVSNGYYRIKKIISGAPWDVETRSPLSEPGVNIKAGDYILAVNGVPLSTDAEPYEAFQGLGDKTVELTVNSQPSPSGAKKVLVKTLQDESRLRHLEWIENNRKMVEEATNGRVGYVYVRSTGRDGQNELVRQFRAQFDKDGLIVDERFNSGGQIPDRFIEMLNRKPLAFWAVRDGQTWQWPPVANFGPKAMLINGWSGSGGDAFPDYFRKSGLGPLVGSRTWGGLIGISGTPGLIDGGGVTVPTFRMYDPDGQWFKEGHGVDPDIEVKENPGELSKGVDAQLVRAIDWINEALKDYEGLPERPAKETR